jgi:hypothetical protein
MLTISGSFIASCTAAARSEGMTKVRAYAFARIVRVTYLGAARRLSPLLGRGGMCLGALLPFFFRQPHTHYRAGHLHLRFE